MRTTVLDKLQASRVFRTVMAIVLITMLAVPTSLLTARIRRMRGVQIQRIWNGRTAQTAGSIMPDSRPGA